MRCSTSRIEGEVRAELRLVDGAEEFLSASIRRAGQVEDALTPGAQAIERWFDRARHARIGAPREQRREHVLADPSRGGIG